MEILLTRQLGYLLSQALRGKRSGGDHQRSLLGYLSHLIAYQRNAGVSLDALAHQARECLPADRQSATGWQCRLIGTCYDQRTQTAQLLL